MNGHPPAPEPEPGAALVELVELVDANGNPIGVSEKLAAHQAPGLLHRAEIVGFKETGRGVNVLRATNLTHRPGSSDPYYEGNISRRDDTDTGAPRIREAEYSRFNEDFAHTYFRPRAHRHDHQPVLLARLGQRGDLPRPARRRRVPDPHPRRAHRVQCRTHRPRPPRYVHVRNGSALRNNCEHDPKIGDHDPCLVICRQPQGRVHDPTVVPNGDGTLTPVLAGCGTPKPLPTTGTTTGTNPVAAPRVSARLPGRGARGAPRRGRSGAGRRCG